MRRRTLLKWISGGLGAICAAVVGVPGVSFVLEALRRNGSSGELTRRVARLKDLPIGKPVALPIIGARQDAWTVHSDEVLGRVWLVRRNADAAEQSVAAFTATCPHLGCMIQHDAKDNRFVCPCHRAVFGLDGEKLSGGKHGKQNHAPRAMDSLECQLVTDEDTQEVWVEVTYQKFEQGLTKKVCKA
jgi:Rieske Fe-S protein